MLLYSVHGGLSPRGIAQGSEPRHSRCRAQTLSKGWKKKEADTKCWAQTVGVPVGQRRGLIFILEAQVVEAFPAAEPEQVE